MEDIRQLQLEGDRCAGDDSYINSVRGDLPWLGDGIFHETGDESESRKATVGICVRRNDSGIRVVALNTGD